MGWWALCALPGGHLGRWWWWWGGRGGTRPAYLTDQDGAGAGMLLARVQHCFYLLLAEVEMGKGAKRDKNRIRQSCIHHLLKTALRGLHREKDDAVNCLVVFLGQ